MAKITRVNGNVRAFGSAQESGERTLFGQTAVSDDLTAQFTAEFLRGWGIVGASDFPKLQDFNAATFTNGQLLAYLHQMGVAEYNAAQEFYLNSVTQFNGVLYMSIQNANTGRQPNTNPAWWKPLLPVQATDTVAGILKIATLALALAGTDDLTAMTPSKVRSALTAFFPKRTFLATADFIRIPDVPGGLIIQWAEGVNSTIGAGGLTAQSISLPTTYPNAVLKSFVTIKYVSGVTTVSTEAPTGSTMSAVSVNMLNPVPTGTGTGRPVVLSIGF